jgi:hypothetical protein
MSLARTPSIKRSPALIFLQPGDHAQQCGLATAGRADEDDEFAVLDVEVDPLDDLDIAIGFAPRAV